MKPLVHYTSGELRLRIRKLFEIPKASGRRVVIVAYIGVDYATFLPKPKAPKSSAVLRPARRALKLCKS